MVTFLINLLLRVLLAGTTVNLEILFIRRVILLPNSGRTNYSIMHQNIRNYSNNFYKLLVVLESFKSMFSCIILTKAVFNKRGRL